MTDPDDDVLSFMNELGVRLTRGTVAAMTAAEDLVRKRPKKAPKKTFQGVFGGFITDEMKEARASSRSEEPFAVDVVGYERLAMARLAAARADGAQKLPGAPTITEAANDARAYRNFRRAYEVVIGSDAVTDEPLTDDEIAHRKRDIPAAWMCDARLFHRQGTSVLSQKADKSRADMIAAHQDLHAPKRIVGRSRDRVLVRGE